MEIWILIEVMVFISSIVYAVLCLVFIKQERSTVTAAMCVVASVFLLLLSVVISLANKRPTAMDVYKGKTTLEITYKDGVAIDSTVVFKTKRNDYDTTR